MKDRIKELLLNEGLTSGTFADAIGVQRSSVSHILNGRNNPSLDFVIKTKTRFPKLNLLWLIMGEGSMYLSEGQLDIPHKPYQTPAPTIFQSPPDDLKVDTPVQPAKEPELEDVKPHLPSHKVSQIVIFYDDMSFSSYTPNSD